MFCIRCKGWVSVSGFSVDTGFPGRQFLFPILSHSSWYDWYDKKMSRILISNIDTDNRREDSNESVRKRGEILQKAIPLQLAGAVSRTGYTHH